MTKKLHEILDDENIKKLNTTKGANSNNIEAIRTRAKGSPRNSWDNGKSKVRGTVKEFIKIFNQDALPKPENEPNHLQMNENEVKIHMPTMQEKKPSPKVTIANHMSIGEAQKNNNGSSIDHGQFILFFYYFMHVGFGKVNLVGRSLYYSDQIKLVLQLNETI